MLQRSEPPGSGPITTLIRRWPGNHLQKCCGGCSSLTGRLNCISKAFSDSKILGTCNWNNIYFTVMMLVLEISVSLGIQKKCVEWGKNVKCKLKVQGSFLPPEHVPSCAEVIILIILSAILLWFLDLLLNSMTLWIIFN